MAAPTVSAAKCPVSHEARTFNPFTEAYLQDPYRFLRDLRRVEPVFYSEELDYWVVTRYEDVRSCFRDQDVFSAAIALDPLKPLYASALSLIGNGGFVPGDAMVNEDPPNHAERRKRLLKNFAPPRLKALEPFIREKTTGFIDRFVHNGRADLVGEFVYELPALVLFRLVGIPDADVPMVKKWSTPLAEFQWGFPSEAEQSRLLGILRDYWQYADRHVGRLMADPTGDDIVSEMVRAHKENPEIWDRAYVTRLMLETIFAGHETTTDAAGNAIRTLLEHPSQWEALCRDPALIPNAVEECLRYTSSVIAWRRLTKRPVTIGGVNIPEGAKLLIYNGSANRDEHAFANSETFDITRGDAGKHVAFGYGPHFCIGAPLARLELRVILEELARRLPRIRLTKAQTWTYSPNTSFRGPQSLWVEWDPAVNPVPEDRPPA